MLGAKAETAGTMQIRAMESFILGFLFCFIYCDLLVDTGFGKIGSHARTEMVLIFIYGRLSLVSRARGVKRSYFQKHFSLQRLWYYEYGVRKAYEIMKEGGIPKDYKLSKGEI